MTETFEDEPDDEIYEVVDEDARAAIDELHAQVEAQAAERERIAEITADLDAFQRAHGIKLDRQTAQAMGEAMELDGADVADAYNASVETDFTEVFDQAVERLERKQGRTILQSESDVLWQHATNQDDPENLPTDKLLDLDNPRDRAALIDERLNPPPDPAETIQPLDVDASSDERAAWAEARVAGAEIEPSEDEF